MKMMMTTRFFMAAVVALALAGCEKAGPNSQGESKIGGAGGGAKPEASSPAGVVTKSGIEMVCLPGGEFIMGNDHGAPDEAPATRSRSAGS